MATDTRRDLLLAAMIRVVGSKGYKETSVANVIEAANTSRTTFYKYFDDKHECFLAAYEKLMEEVFSAVQAGCDPAQTWLERVEGGLTTLVRLFARDPALARTAVVEVAAAGTEARRLHWRAIDRFTEFLEPGREMAAERELPRNIGLMSAGAVCGLIFDELLGGRAAQLPAQLPELVFAMLVPYIGPRAAAEEMRRVAESR